jgi:hypothetical protein
VGNEALEPPAVLLPGLGISPYDPHPIG